MKYLSLKQRANDFRPTQITSQTHASRARAAAVAAEFALVLPFFILVLLGILEAARLGMVAQIMNVAARDACRTAILSGTSHADVESRITTLFAPAGIDPRDVTLAISPSDWESSEAGDAITVQVEVPFEDVSWTGDPFSMTTGSIVGIATMSSER